MCAVEVKLEMVLSFAYIFSVFLSLVVCALFDMFGDCLVRQVFVDFCVCEQNSWDVI